MQLSHPSLEVISKLPPLHSTLIKFIQIAGALYGYLDADNKRYIDHFPFAALPYSLKKSQHQTLKSNQHIWSKLFVKLASDPEFINKTLDHTAKQDPFVRSLLEIFNGVKNPQEVQMNISRNDYMLDECTNQFLMVQFNLMSVSMTYASDKIQEVQKNVLSNYFPKHYQHQNFTEFRNTHVVCDAMIETIKLAGVKGKVVMVVQKDETNVFDQGLIESGILQRGNQVIRATFQELFEGLRLDQESLNITYRGEDIALFYYRDGYVPTNYESPNSWKVRETVERSRAIKVPTIAMQLVNTKRIQQQLYCKETLAKYLPEDEYLKIHKEMAAQYNFESDETFDKVLKEIDPAMIILKPNRDGGNNNYFGQDAISKLQKSSKQERKQFILMNKICPESVPNVFFRKGVSISESQSVSQLSVNSIFIYKGNELIADRYAGGMVRTKNVGTKEGGVRSQSAVLTGIYQTDSTN